MRRITSTKKQNSMLIEGREGDFRDCQTAFRWFEGLGDVIKHGTLGVFAFYECIVIVRAFM